MFAITYTNTLFNSQDIVENRTIQIFSPYPIHLELKLSTFKIIFTDEKENCRKSEIEF